MLEQAIERSSSRIDLWVEILRAVDAHAVAEIGVFRGDFAAHLLGACPGIERYFMVDPWRHLTGWNKPANKSDETFEGFYRETLEKTEGYADKRVVLRGRTTEVSAELPDSSLDVAYIDGDHTLRGITIDLHRLFPKVRTGGWLGGDDFTPSIWQHRERFEPTLVFPYAVYFAEAVGARLYALPWNQFLLQKTADGFEFADLTGRYEGLDLRAQLDQRPGGPASRSADAQQSASGVARLRRRLSRIRAARTARTRRG